MPSRKKKAPQRKSPLLPVAGRRVLAVDRREVERRVTQNPAFSPA